jgi:DNA-directed RNA polymerase subunit F
VTENEKLRELLKEARDVLLPLADAEPIAEFVNGIDAALAEPAEVHPSSLTDVVTLLENERDAARDEIERLTSVIERLRWDREMACQGCGK